MLTSNITSCNRRLSRAAREILKRELERSPSSTESPTNLWELLEELLRPDADLSQCPLLSHKDILRHHEENSLIIPAQGTRHGALPGPTPAPGRKRGRRNRNWYQCGLCQKVFSSRYYLDQHMNQYHADELGNTDIDTAVCPATTWCEFLSNQACQDIALELEQYYDRGSEGYGDDRYAIRRKLFKQAHAEECTTSQMEQAKTKCQDVVQSCFEGGLQEYLLRTLCRPMSCPDRIHRLFFNTAGNAIKQVYEWQEDWAYWSAEHHNVGWIGVLVVMSLILWYAKVILGRRQVQPRRNNAGTRLLRKSPSKCRFMGFSPTKKKQL